MNTTPVNPFVTHLPVDVRFGDGAAAQLPQVLAGLRAERWVAVVDAAVVDHPQLRAPLADAHAVLIVEPGEPSLVTVDALGGRVAQAAPDAVVVMGGGSALDSAKGARLVAETKSSISRYCWPGAPQAVPPLATPLVALPTTAGTGSEVTGGVVMLDPARGIKVAAPSPYNRPTVALVDPELTHSLPPLPTLYGALDILAQAIGAMTSITRSPVADGIALEALTLVRDALPAVVEAPDGASRNRIAAASLMAGLAMNLSEAGSDHSLGHAIGVRYGIPHGLSVAVVLVEAMEHERLGVTAQLERIADALGAPPAEETEGERAVVAVRELLQRVGCPTLAELNVVEADVPELAQSALAAWIPVSPVPWSRNDVESAYRRALARPSATEAA